MRPGRQVDPSAQALGGAFTGGQVTEIWTTQDQFAFPKQIGYLPDSVRAA